VRDTESGNLRGGLRLPPITVPIASYVGDAPGCPLMDYHETYSAGRLAELTPTHSAYVTAMEKAARTAVRSGIMLPEGASELLRQVRASSIPQRPTAILPS
jgi:hypothetical protein